MATFEQIFQRLQEQRDATSEKSPVADSLNRLADAMSVMRKGIASLDESIKENRVAQGAARNLAQADDVKEQIRTLLELKVSEDAIERERHQRMMDIAESIIPQVTDEQLDAIREQRKAYREQQWALKEELRIAEETAQVQRDNSKAIADAEKFAINDKYGTISGAVGGLESKAQDPLSKFLVQGLGRFVKGKEDDKTKAVAKAQADRDRIIDRDVAWKKEDIQEDAAIDAYRKGIKDPGSAVALLKQRDQQVSNLAKVGESTEAGIVSGNYRAQRSNKRGKSRSREEQAKDMVADASPAVKQAISGEWTPVAQTKAEPQPVVQETTPVAQTKAEPQPTASPAPAPENARFKKADTQTTSPVTPSKTPVKSPASVGAFGSKAGAVNLSGIGKLIGGIVGPIKSIAGSFLKFLGPWGFVAHALMSFDRLVPIISNGAGAIMDIAKLVMPLAVTALLEGFQGLLQVIDGIAEFLSEKLFGSGMMNKYSYENARRLYDRKENEQWEKEKKIKEAISSKKATQIDTTSAKSNLVGSSSISRVETPLTTPAEATTISEQMKNTQASSQTDALAASMEEQRIKDQAFKDSVMAVAKNPGTTPVMTANPYMLSWNV